MDQVVLFFWGSAALRWCMLHGGESKTGFFVVGFDRLATERIVSTYEMCSPQVKSILDHCLPSNLNNSIHKGFYGDETIVSPSRGSMRGSPGGLNASR